jgi:general secretion pathway protein A
MYVEHFGLAELPFSLTPDPRYVYMSERHREALAHLIYGINQGDGFVQLTGEVGTGKTTMCRCLLEQLPPDVDVALIFNPRLTSHELLAAVCDELRVAYPAGTDSVKLLVDSLYRHLLGAHARGRRTVLIIDEAQNLSVDVLEQVRLLTNLETARDKLLQIILIGQTELAALLERPELRQLAQRVTARYHLRPFSQDETRAYIVHRLGVAGRTRMLFSPWALREVHRLSRGVPRLINVICDRALLGAYATSRSWVDVHTVRRAAREVRGVRVGGRRLPWILRRVGAAPERQHGRGGDDHGHAAGVGGQWSRGRAAQDTGARNSSGGGPAEPLHANGSSESLRGPLCSLGAPRVGRGRRLRARSSGGPAVSGPRRDLGVVASARSARCHRATHQFR